MANLFDILSSWLAQLMVVFFQWTFSWGWAIILLTLLLKIILFPTSISQIRYMESMKKIQPLLKEVQDKYKDKPEEYQKRTMEIYKENNVNMLGGCFPFLLQIPFLWGLFNLLNTPHKFFTPEQFNSFKSASFLGINLMLKQSYTIGFLSIVILSGLTTFVLQKISATTSSNDQFQKSFLYFMPIMFAFFTWRMPAGLGIYWTISNVIGIVQQFLIIKYFIPKHQQAESITVKAKKK